MDNNNSNMSRVRNLLIYLGIPIIVILIMSYVLSQSHQDATTYSDVISYFKENSVTEFTVKGSGKSATLDMKLDDKHDGKIIKYKLLDYNIFWNDIQEYINTTDKKLESESLATANEASTIKPIKYDLQPTADNSFWLDMIPIGILIIALFFFWFFIMRRMGAGGLGGKEMNFGKAKFKNNTDEKKKTTLTMLPAQMKKKKSLKK